MKYNFIRTPEQVVEESKARCPPVFVSLPDAVTVEEGEWARFCCRVTGHPKPRVMWLLNGNTIVNVIIIINVTNLVYFIINMRLN